MTKITVTLTHCNRLDLLNQTIQSFRETNTYPIDEFLIYDDSADDNTYRLLMERFGDECSIFHSSERIGQRRALDTLFTASRNDYIFHLEDDWLFDTSNQYIENSIHILDNDPTIHQMWVRHPDDNPHKTIGDCSFIDNVGYFLVDPDFRGVWNGFSWNPGLRRKSDYIKMFPNGFQDVGDEMKCSQHSRSFQYKVVRLKDTACHHIGHQSSNPNNI